MKLSQEGMGMKSSSQYLPLEELLEVGGEVFLAQHSLRITSVAVLILRSFAFLHKPPRFPLPSTEIVIGSQSF
jgi:hypothetical protein